MRICTASKFVSQSDGLKLALNQFRGEKSAGGSWMSRAHGREVLAGLGVVAVTVCEAMAAG